MLHPVLAMCIIRSAGVLALVRRGDELRLAFSPNDQSAPTREDVRLIGLMAKAETAHIELLGSEPVERVRRAHLTRMARLKFLVPDIMPLSSMAANRHS